MIEIYDINSLKTSIEKLVASHELEDARGMYLECIMDWTDHYTENLLIPSSENMNEREIALKSLSQVWIDYANMETSQRQYKKAVLIFEKALEDPVAKTLPDIYLAYSTFCEDRGKLPNARNVLIKGVTNQLPSSSEGCDRIWLELLNIMHKSGSENLSLQLLLDVIKLEKGENVVTMPTNHLLNPPSVAVDSTMSTNMTETNTAAIDDNSVTQSYDDRQQQQQQEQNEFIAHESSYIESKENDDDDNEAMMITTSAAVEEATTFNNQEVGIIQDNSHENMMVQQDLSFQQQQQQDYPTSNISPIASTIHSTAATIIINNNNIDLTLDVMHSKLTPEQLNKKYAKHPPMLFSITENDIKNFRLDSKELLEIENFLGEPLILAVSTLIHNGALTGSSSGGVIDSNGRFIPADILTSSSSSLSPVLSMTEGSKKLKMVLNLLESIWTIQALKERHFNAWFYQLQELQMAEEKKFVEDSTRNNMNITSATTTASTVHKRMKMADSTGANNTNIDFKLFENHCHVQLEIIQSTINYTLLNLLIEQQMILYEIGFPRFSLALIQQLKSCITTTSTSTTSSNIVKYDTPQIMEIINYQKRLVIGLLSLRLNPVVSNLYRNERDLSFYLSSFPNTTLTTTTGAIGSINASNIQSIPFQQQQLNSDGSSIDPLTDYYSFEAKTRRRKRRMQDINNSSSSNVGNN